MKNIIIVKVSDNEPMFQIMDDEHVRGIATYPGRINPEIQLYAVVVETPDDGRHFRPRKIVS